MEEKISGAAEKRKRDAKSSIDQAEFAACAKITVHAGGHGGSDLHRHGKSFYYNLEKGFLEPMMLMYFRSKKKTARDVSLYEPIGTDKEGNQIKLLDIVESGEPGKRVVEKKNILRL